MDIFDQVRTAVERCEHELRDLGAVALKKGNYDAARRIAELAESVADSCVRGGMAEAPARSPASPKQAAATSGVNQSPVSGENTQGTVHGKRNGAGSYPQFCRSGEKLVKVGWSKKNRQEYEHNAPWPMVSSFAEHLRTHVRSGRIFSIESLLPVPDPGGHGELPSYQIYLALAWLRNVNLVEKRGRDGYVTDRAALSDKALGQHWLSLPAKKV